MVTYKKRKYQFQMCYSDFGDHKQLSTLRFTVRKTENDRTALCNYFQS